VIHGRGSARPAANAYLLTGRIPGAELAIIKGGQHGYLVEFREEASRIRERVSGASPLSMMLPGLEERSGPGRPSLDFCTKKAFTRRKGNKRCKQSLQWSEALTDVTCMPRLLGTEITGHSLYSWHWRRQSWCASSLTICPTPSTVSRFDLRDTVPRKNRQTRQAYQEAYVGPTMWPGNHICVRV